MEYLDHIKVGDTTYYIKDASAVTQSAVTEQIQAAVSGKMDTDVFETYSASTAEEIAKKLDATALTEFATEQYVDNAVSGKVDTSAYNSYTADTKTQIDGKQPTGDYALKSEIPTSNTALTNDAGYITEAALSGFATEQYVDNAVSGKVDTSVYSGYTAETATAIEAKADASDIPTSTSALTNDSGFITNLVDDLVNYYLKSENYTKEEVNQLIAAVQQFHYEVVAVLPEPSSATTGIIYLVPSASAATQNIKDEFITIYDDSTYKWEQIGSTAIDLSGYVTSGDLQTALASYALLTDIPTSNSAFTNDEGYITGITSGDVTTALGYTPLDDNAISGKADTSAVTEAISAATSGLQETLVSGTNIKTINNQSLLGSGNIDIQGGGGGSNIIELTKAEYEALVDPDPDTLYVITDAEEVDLSDYLTSAQTMDAITAITATKADAANNTTYNSGNYYFPRWSQQGIITGTTAQAYSVNENINGTNYAFYRNSSSSLPTIYAPTAAGTANQPLLSNGSGAPVWGTYKFVFCTQATYDGLTPDSTTIYFITD